MPANVQILPQDLRNAGRTGDRSTPPRNIALGYLRAFITLLVVAHHSALAYHPDAPAVATSLATQPRWWQAFPVVDAHRWAGFSAFIGFNDVFFMALMFLLSGLFVTGSLERKGASRFVRDRALRLGIPFLAAAAVIAPLAYYPTYLQQGGTGVAGFWREWLSLGSWPAGPPWFAWVLLAFDCVAVLLFAVLPRWAVIALAGIAGTSDRRPGRVFWRLFAISALAYLPFVLHWGPFYWFSVGPFFLQASRPLFYLVYFLAGVALGSEGLNSGLFSADGRLARRWLLWSVFAFVAFALVVVLVIASIAAPATAPKLTIPSGLAFALSAGASSFAFLAIFLHFTRKPRPAFDSLTANAYGIYLIHYAFMSWVQYSLLKLDLSGFAKGGLTFVAATVLSWASIAFVRRIPAVARVL
jgi:peptidoglycan/LPS O-acetylase OafA/YrhL